MAPPLSDQHSVALLSSQNYILPFFDSDTNYKLFFWFIVLFGTRQEPRLMQYVSHHLVWCHPPSLYLLRTPNPPKLQSSQPPPPPPACSKCRRPDNLRTLLITQHIPCPPPCLITVSWSCARKSHGMRRVHGEARKTMSSMNWPKCCPCRRPSQANWTRRPS